MSDDGRFKFFTWRISGLIIETPHTSQLWTDFCDWYVRTRVLVQWGALLGSKRYNFQFWPLILPKPQFLVLPMHFLWKTKILISFQPLITEQTNFTSLIVCICATIMLSQKLEFQNPRWPLAPFWIFLKFTKFWITFEPFNRFSPNFNPGFSLWS